jgi:hypothetical protein
MKVVGEGVVFSPASDDERQSAAFPGVCVLPGGRWLCGFRAAPTKIATCRQKALITWSDDEGASWSVPLDPFDPPTLDGKQGNFRGAYLTALGEQKVLAALYWVDASNPDLPFYNEETEGLLDSRIFLAASDDGGRTWTEPWLVDTSPYDLPTPLTGPVLRLEGSRLACQFETNKTYYDTSVWRHSAVMQFSSDGGKSWDEHVVTGRDPENKVFYWDQRPAVLRDGRLLNLFWTYDREKGVYLGIEARESFDNGKTWSGFWDTGVHGQPAQPVSLPGGGTGMVYVDRSSGPPLIKMRASRDNGRTWPEETEIILYGARMDAGTKEKRSMKEAWAEMAAFACGLPATGVIGNGDILVVYYAGAHPDRTCIHWVRVRP